jgi:hypothetical protein
LNAGRARATALLPLGKDNSLLLQGEDGQVGEACSDGPGGAIKAGVGALGGIR